MPNIIQIKRGDADVLDEFVPLEDGELAVTKHTQITGGPQAGEKVLDSTLRVGVVTGEYRGHAIIGSETVIYETSYFVHIVSLLSQYCRNIEVALKNDFINVIGALDTNFKKYEDTMNDLLNVFGKTDSDIFKFLDLTSYKIYSTVSFLYGVVGTVDEALEEEYISHLGDSYYVNESIIKRVKKLADRIGSASEDSNNLVYNNEGSIINSLIKALNNVYSYILNIDYTQESFKNLIGSKGEDNGYIYDETGGIKRSIIAALNDLNERVSALEL